MKTKHDKCNEKFMQVTFIPFIISHSRTTSQPEYPSLFSYFIIAKNRRIRLRTFEETQGDCVMIFLGSELHM